jgi:hypothetical protein
MEHASKCLRDYRGGANQGALIRGVLVEHNNALMGILSTTTAAAAPVACPCGPQLSSAHASIALLKIQLQELTSAFADLSAAFSAPAELPADDAPAQAQVLAVCEPEPAEKCAPLAVAAVVAAVVVPIAVAAISSKPEADAVQVGAVATSVSPSKKSESVSASSGDDHEAQQELIAQQMAALMESDDAHSSDRLESISVRRMATAQQVVALSKQHRALGKTAARKTKAKAPK